MRKLLLIFTVLLGAISVKAQELNATVTVVAQQTGNENLQLFKNLERQLKEFVNNRTWTNKTFKFTWCFNCRLRVNTRTF